MNPALRVCVAILLPALTILAADRQIASAEEQIRTPRPLKVPPPVTLPWDQYGHSFSSATSIGVLQAGNSSQIVGHISSPTSADWISFVFGAPSVVVTLTNVTPDSDFNLSVYGQNMTLLVSTTLRGNVPKALTLRDDGQHQYTVAVTAYRWDAKNPNFTLNFAGQAQ